MKKVLLIVIDGCGFGLLETAMHNVRVPHIAALRDAGVFRAGISVFPSVTHAALASLVTGHYPSQHGILGTSWYDMEKNRVAYQSADWDVVYNNGGIGNFFKDFMLRLNRELLQQETLFQIVERKERQAASLNYPVFRGDVEHEVNIPLLLNLSPDVPSYKRAYGPSLLCLGDFVPCGLAYRRGPSNWFGLKDDSTADMLIQMAQRRAFPDLTVAYFPEYDAVSHRQGPKAAIAVLENLNKRLGEVVGAFGDMDAVLDEFCVILTADHAQSAVIDDDRAAIRLDELLSNFPLAGVGQPWRPSDEFMICPSMRTVQFYFRELDLVLFHSVIAQLLADKRIDQVLWRADITEPDEAGYRVATRERGALHFWPGSSGRHSAVDDYGNTWCWTGDLRAVDGHVWKSESSSPQASAGRSISFPCYPNAFERIAGVLANRHSGHLWATAQSGYEFSLPGIQSHRGGGSHGSLHLDDSTVPVLIAGAPAASAPGAGEDGRLRLVDIAPFCLSILEIESEINSLTV